MHINAAVAVWSQISFDQAEISYQRCCSYAPCLIVYLSLCCSAGLSIFEIVECCGILSRSVVSCEAGIREPNKITVMIKKITKWK